jgi:L-erythro-3,5-diaminohexanoate dehydrogenase
MTAIATPTSHPLGIHRVLEPAGALPQAAWKLDASTDTLHPDEAHLEVERLNVDSASFRQIEESVGHDPARIGQAILDIVGQRGKLHNPVTGSGGMLLGRVKAVGGLFAERPGAPRPGDRIGTLVSLTLTPLAIDRLVAVDPAVHQVIVEGRAVLFASAAFARMPADLDEGMVLSALDVAGAAPQVERLAQPGGRVLVLGAGGKSGLLCCMAARRRIGPKGGGGLLVGLDRDEAAVADLRALGICDRVEIADAADPLAVMDRATGGGETLYDLAVSCVNVQGAEMGAILSTRDGGDVYFFSMATSFSRAALGAEGVSRDVRLLIGNGYCPGHAEATLALLRSEPALRAVFERRYGTRKKETSR